MKRLGIFLIVAVLVGLVGVAPASAANGSTQSQSSAAASTIVYVVRPGDTLAKLAVRFGTSITAILRANPSIKNPNRIFVGQRLVITSASAVFSKVQIALIAMEGGNIGCGDGVVMVTRNVTPTRAPLTAAIQQLLSIHTQYYGESGLYTALYQSRLSVQSVTINNGTAVIRLTGTYQVGGVCDEPRVKAQFEFTAKQFSTVKAVQVYINGRPLSSYGGKG